MVKFTVEEVRRIMNEPQNIRNISVIAHVDHGKSTLSDALICKAGIISSKVAGQARALDNRLDEIQRGITIKSTGVSLYYKYDIQKKDKVNKQEEYLINLIDSPGHVDFSSEVTAALRVTDGALVVVDTVEGVCVQTQTVLRQAMMQRIRPVLMINKVDRSILELKLDGEQIYQKFIKTIDNVNVVISTYQNKDMQDLMLDPSLGNVSFGAGKDQWAFTLRTFARIYADKFKINEDKMMQKLWGDNYYDSEGKKWKNQPISDTNKPLKRAFVELIMDPICLLFNLIMQDKQEQWNKLLNKINIELTNDQKKEQNLKKKLKIIMNKWLPAADCLLEVIIQHLPSPIQAQKYRTSYLYQGQSQDQCSIAMSKCDPKGPLSIYISKMIPIDNNRFAAFGRIFSGTIITGQKVRIMGANFIYGKKNDLYEKSVSQLGVFMMGKAPEYIQDVPCGNTVAIMGIDDYILKTGTIVNCQYPNSYPIRCMKYSVSPVYRVAIKAKNVSQLPKLQKGLKKLSKSDPLIKIDIEQTGEIVIAGSGELHIEICLNDLKSFSQCEIICTEPTVSYKETITKNNQHNLLVKTANKHNRIWANCQQIEPELVELIENEQLGPKCDQKTRSKKLIEEYKWDKIDTQKIWDFGPQNIGANILVDCIKAGQYITEIKDSICTAFQQTTKHGVLTQESMRGIRFNLKDAQVHSDPIHRNGVQIMPASRRLLQGLQLSCSPTLQQPIFLCEISAPSSALAGVYQTINQKRGLIIEELHLQGSDLRVIKSHLPVAQSFGLSSILRENTHGKAFPQCFFDHWQEINGIPFEDPKATELILKIRKRKGMKQELPNLNDFIDKL